MINKQVDFTLLKPYADVVDHREFFGKARKYNPYAVCVFPMFAKMAYHEFKETDIKICAVIGFPFGNNSTATKVLETSLIRDYVDEIDVVMNIADLKSGHFRDVMQDIRAVRKESIWQWNNLTLKVIIETCYLTEAEKRMAIEICLQTGADYVKTSTGYGTSGATVEDIKLIKSIVGEDCRIKASGGIKTLEFAQELIKAGADRIGSSTEL